MKLSLLINSDTLICIWILVLPIFISEVSTPRNCSFCLYFSSLHNYWPPITWNPLVHTSFSEMEQCEERAFQLFKMRKKIKWNKETKCLTDYLFTVRSTSMKEYICHYGVSTYTSNLYINFIKNNENLVIFF